MLIKHKTTNNSCRAAPRPEGTRAADWAVGVAGCAVEPGAALRAVLAAAAVPGRVSRPGRAGAGGLGEVREEEKDEVPHVLSVTGSKFWFRFTVSGLPRSITMWV